MKLLVDVGNSRLKWAAAADGVFAKQGCLNNPELDRVRLAGAWQDLPQPSAMAVACVAGDRIYALISAVAQALWPGIGVTRAVSEARAYGVTNGYLRPEKLGVDRWLTLLAARHHYSLPACIADCGTAITVDWLDHEGLHLGGMICPGLTLMKQSLSTGTEALAFDQSGHPPGLADFTEAAIFNGVVNAAAGLIERAYAVPGLEGRLLITGGDADLVAGYLGCDAVVDPDLVLRGLSVILAGTV